MNNVIKRAPFNYVDCVHISVARKIARFAFPDHFVNAIKNLDNRTYDIYLKEDGVDLDSIEYFKEFWGKQYRLFLVPEA